MKAYVLHDINRFTLEEVPTPLPGENEVLIKVQAAGICGSDIPRLYRTGTYSYPLIPGHEFSGIVTELGKGVDASWYRKRVGVYPLIPCGECVPCQKKKFELCRHYSYLGSRRNGAFAEYAAVPAENLIELPENVALEEAAMMEPMSVAVHAMRRMMLLPQDNIVICGLGTIGLLLCMFLKEAGAERLFAVGNKDVQRRAALSMGILPENYCDIRTQNAAEWISERTGGRGADAFFECVGKNETAALAVSAAAPEGKIMLVGNPGSDMSLEKSVYWKILRNQLTVAGTWNSSYTGEKSDDWHYVLERLEKKRIFPAALITHRVPLEQLPEGCRIMRDKTEDYVKIMVACSCGF